MSPTRTPIDPPHLDGYSFKKKLGSGGFADVFLYERSFPRQDVAIKVLDRQMPGTEGRDRFADEANAMASLSTHPFIVTIFHADVSPEAHPYLVMEYYPGANFAVRSRSERLSVAQVLRLGVQVASAVETAHRAGILHRDIKPANILTSAYGRPGLTDFGIAGSLEQGTSTAEGLSIPWSPPEALDGLAATDGRSDIYSLAATLYSILDGRSPFERSDRSTSQHRADRADRAGTPPRVRSTGCPRLALSGAGPSHGEGSGQSAYQCRRVRPHTPVNRGRATLRSDAPRSDPGCFLPRYGTADRRRCRIDPDQGPERHRQPEPVFGFDEHRGARAHTEASRRSHRLGTVRGSQATSEDPPYGPGRRCARPRQ